MSVQAQVEDHRLRDDRLLRSGGRLFFLYPTVYESQAKLLVRYVVDTSSIDQVDSENRWSRYENLINSEVEILTSWDLAMQVANAVGIDRLVPNSKARRT